jgi:hypothetical protein
MRTKLFDRFGAQVFGTFGLVLVLLVSKLARYEVTPEDTYPQRARAWLARRAMDGIGAIGWLVDRLPLASVGRDAHPHRNSRPAVTSRRAPRRALP